MYQNILIVDDSRAARDMLRRQVKATNPKADITEVKNGQEAVDACRDRAYDLVFMDITMPVKDGFEATAEINAENPDSNVVMVTAHRSESKVQQARDAGAKGYIAKPLNPNVIERVFHTKQTKDETSEPADVIVLIADDSRTHRSIIRKYIDALELKVEVHEAVDGEDAIAVFKEHNPDLVFLDVNMPNLGGVRALEEIRIHDPHANVYMISANANEEIRDECLALGAQRFLSKPFGRHEVEQALNRSVTFI